MQLSFIEKIYLSHQNCPQCPSPKSVTAFYKNLMGFLFPDHADEPFHSRHELDTYLENLRQELQELLFMPPNGDPVQSQAKQEQFFEELPSIYEALLEDKKAIFDWDPAAYSESEVIKTYPGFYAIAAYRIAHQLHLLDVKIIPRMITEFAHSKTGIDIHPGAEIGKSFCIDHGTGVVIGETCVIGDEVKVYQGVTLGALSIFKKGATQKRHPSIGNQVVIYSGATILGGDTEIGHNSIIGGNTWITKSVPPYSKVYYKASVNGSTNTGQSTLTKKL